MELASTSDALFSMADLPRRVIIVGGGYIGVEFTGILHGLGVEVMLVNPSACVLTHFDAEVRAHLESELRRQGVRLHLGRHPTRLERWGDGYRLHLDVGDPLEADRVFFATGRAPATQGLGLVEVGVALGDRGEVKVNQDFQSSVPSIFAVGDVTGGAALTPVAIAEGHFLANRWFGDGSLPPPALDLIPTAVFSRPNVGTVGLAEHEAKARGYEIRVFTSAFRPMLHTVSGREERTFLKLVVDAATDRVLGLHIVGDDAGEIVQGFAVAMRAGATKRDFDRTLGIHPTAAEELVTMRTPRP
jgi:glutathione reductase (NADPH)